MEKEEKRSSPLIETSPDFNARIKQQGADLLVDINRECFRVAKANGLPPEAAVMNSYPVLLQVIGQLIERQHKAVCLAVLHREAHSKGPVG